MSERYQPDEKTVFWCEKCDSHLVDSEDKSTGHFYTVSGHTYNRSSKVYDGEYVSVLFAVCSHCEEEKHHA